MEPKLVFNRTSKVGVNDKFITTLRDNTLTYEEGGLRSCGECGHVRVSHVEPCIHCSKARAHRALAVWAVLLLAALVIVAAYYLGHVPPARHIGGAPP